MQDQGLLQKSPLSIKQAYKRIPKFKYSFLFAIILGVIGIGLAIYLPFTKCANFSVECPGNFPPGYGLLCERAQIYYCCLSLFFKTCGDGNCRYLAKLSDYEHVCSDIAIYMGICLGVSVILGVVAFVILRKQRIRLSQFGSNYSQGSSQI